MTTTVFIALAAGCASALMFASIVSGALISLVLFYLAPLPLMVAALGWGPLSASIGGLAAATGLGAVFGLPYCIAFVLTVALPASWLGHLTLLGRPVARVQAGNGAAPVAPPLEWYPVGRILLWAAGFAALTTMAALLTLGSDAATISSALRRGLLRIMGLRDAGTSADGGHFADAMVAIAPAAAAIVAMMTLTLNLWLAAKITATSAKLRRPWPDLKSAALPPMTLAGLSLALACSFAGGMLTMFGEIVSAALLTAYALVGFAVLHTLTLSMKGRMLWLGGTYAAVLVAGWPVLAMVVLGLADAVFGFRQRYRQRNVPPPMAAP